MIFEERRLKSKEEEEEKKKRQNAHDPRTRTKTLSLRVCVTNARISASVKMRRLFARAYLCAFFFFFETKSFGFFLKCCEYAHVVPRPVVSKQYEDTRKKEILDRKVWHHWY